MKGQAADLTPRHDLDVPPVLLSYQQKLLQHTADPVVLYEKSRRIGISWAAAEAAVETAAAGRAAGGMDVLYIGYNLEMARGFIDDCAFWAKWLHGFAGEVPEITEFVFEDEADRQIKAYRIDFASGFEIVALPSRPRSLRSKQGFVILDEAAFYDDLAGVIKAAMALLMWGGRVWIISTHDGADNLFNELVEECRAGKKPFTLLRTTFEDAIEQGLYERIALTAPKGVEIKPKAGWVAEIRAYYGDDAAEELDVIPSQGGGVWLTRALIEQCMDPHGRVVYLRCEDGFAHLPDHQREAFVAAWIEDHLDPLIAALDPHCKSLAGGDFGRSGDLSVFWPGQLDRKTQVLRVPFGVELRNVPFREQQQILFHLLDRLPRFVAGAFDARGLGAMLAELAMQRYGATRVAEIKATAEWYRTTMPPLKARFEDKTIVIPRDDDVRQDLRAVKINKGVPMVPEDARTKSARGGHRHGDAAIAAAMLEHACGMDHLEIDFQAGPHQRESVSGFADGGTFEVGRRPDMSGFGVAGTIGSF